MSTLTPAQLSGAVPGAVRKLDPRELVGSPVMLVVEIGAVTTSVLSLISPSTLGWLVTVWLWLTVLFGTLAESVAEGRGKAQAASLRALQTETGARRRTTSRRPRAGPEHVAARRRRGRHRGRGADPRRR